MAESRKAMVERWNQAANEILAGRKIIGAVYVPDPEFGHQLAIELDNGAVIFPMADDEGNDTGSLEIVYRDQTHRKLPRVR